MQLPEYNNPFIQDNYMLAIDRPINPYSNPKELPAQNVQGLFKYPRSIQKFDTGATRDIATDKLDYEGFLSPLVLEAFGTYMHHHRKMLDGSLRDSDNWQKGMPLTVYMKCGWRHFFDWWKEHRGLPSREGLVFALLGLLFNVQGYLHETLKNNPKLLEEALERNKKSDQSV